MRPPPLLVRVEVRSGAQAWMGQGRDLAEALMSLSGMIPTTEHLSPEADRDTMAEVHAARRAIAPVPISLRMSVRSLARWWKPSTWGTVDILMGSEVDR